ncbi:uncharacterized protein V6R79_011378 [Siganus canaliculatus]
MHAEVDKQHCGFTSSSFSSPSPHGLKWTGMKTNKVGYRHNTHKLACSVNVPIEKGINRVVEEQQIIQDGRPSKCTPEPRRNDAENQRADFLGSLLSALRPRQSPSQTRGYSEQSSTSSLPTLNQPDDRIYQQTISQRMSSPVTLCTDQPTLTEDGNLHYSLIDCGAYDVFLCADFSVKSAAACGKPKRLIKGRSVHSDSWSSSPPLQLCYLLSWRFNASAVLMYDPDEKSRHGVVRSRTVMDCARKSND